MHVPDACDDLAIQPVIDVNKSLALIDATYVARDRRWNIHGPRVDGHRWLLRILQDEVLFQEYLVWHQSTRPSRLADLHFFDLATDDRKRAAGLAVDHLAVLHPRMPVGAGMMGHEAVEIGDHFIGLTAIRLAWRTQLDDAVGGRHPCIRHEAAPPVLSSPTG